MIKYPPETKPISSMQPNGKESTNCFFSTILVRAVFVSKSIYKEEKVSVHCMNLWGLCSNLELNRMIWAKFINLYLIENFVDGSSSQNSQNSIEININVQNQKYQVSLFFKKTNS